MAGAEKWSSSNKSSRNLPHIWTKNPKTNKKEIIISRSWEIIITAAKTWKVAYFNIMKAITQNEQTLKIKKQMTLKKKFSLIENEKR